MAIRISPRAADLAGDLAGRFVLLVRGATDATQALAALDGARQELLDLGAAHDVQPVLSPVVLSPDGPMLRVVDLDVDEEALHAVPGMVADALAAAGLDAGTVEVLEPVGPLDALDDVRDAAVLRIFPTPAGADGLLPPRWLDVAAEWALGDASAHERVAVRLLGAPFSLTASDAPAALHAANGARAWCDLVYGDLKGRLRSASLTFGHAPHLTLAAGGPGCDVPALLARFDLLCELARDLREDVAYACVDLEATFEHLGAGLSSAGWRDHGGAAPNAVVSQVGDVAVPDAYPYQVLGPGHLDRWRSHGSAGAPPLGAPLDGGRMEVALGEPVDWLPRYETRDDALAQGWAELTGLLLTDRSLAELVAVRAAGTPGPTSTAEHRAGPDLDDVVLEALPHPRRGLHVTLLELASWIGHEAHSDAPGTVSPVLAAYGRWLASGLDHERRQALKPYAGRLAGTRGPGLVQGGWRPLAPADEARAWMAADALARSHAPAWLRAAGLGSLADRIAKTRPRKDHQHVDRLARLLATAIDLLGSGTTGADEERAWDTWERVSEASGWVAASEAAWVGVPDGLASATELRVIELARHRHEPRGPKDAGRTVVDAARAAALAAAAEAAWQGAGHSAAAAVDGATRGGVNDISLVVAQERAARAAASRLHLDRDAVDQALEQADVAARAELQRFVAEGPARAHPLGSALDAAREAAAESDGGPVWNEVQELTRGVIGEGAWLAAMAAARVAVDRVLQSATSLVDRAVLVAVAREAAGLAARTAATQADETELESVVEELQAAALTLFDALLAVAEPSVRRPRSRTTPKASASVA